ncbi:MAG TPA: DUF4394 domain-containing protein [Actinomycetota bacterium]|nr:DUF4394 domain-containing protein [Actinomycetota bacterium]
MRKALRRGLLLLLAASVLAVPAVANGRVLGDLYGSGDDTADARRSGRSLNAVGLTTDGRLVRFSTDTPGRTRNIGQVQKGLSGDQSLIGIDYRVQDGKLYGVGNTGGIYTLSTADASASKVGQLTVGLIGTVFGVDFNPAANRLRVISNTGQNLRHNIDDATATTPPLAGMTQNDGTLTIPPATTPAAGVTGAAYTNNDLDASTATTLYDIDTMNDTVVVQSPANNGLLAATGKLQVDAATSVGFDIYSRNRFGVTQGNRGFVTVSVLGRYSLFQVNLLAGKLSRVGGFRADTQVVDLAVPLDQG